jgi:SAM-dependent methyltransferase
MMRALAYRSLGSGESDLVGILGASRAFPRRNVAEQRLSELIDMSESHLGGGIDYSRLYEFRFRRVLTAERQRVWTEIAAYLASRLGQPRCVLDAAAGNGELINAFRATERWAVDMISFEGLYGAQDVKRVIGNVLDVDLPPEHFDVIFASNLLEHFASQEVVGAFLQRMCRLLVPGGKIVILGPNFRYCMRDYFDCADHTLALTHKSVEEHLFAAGFEIVSVDAKFLPFSFAGRLPTSRLLVRAYLRFPVAWRVLGKQFLVIGRAPTRREPQLGNAEDTGTVLSAEVDQR